MKFSAPIYILKQQAKALSQRDKLRLHVALDQVAVREGFNAWSHLASVWQRTDTSRSLYEQLRPGDLLLVGSRPGQGKTLLSIGLAVEAMERGNRAAFFTLEYTAAEVENLFTMIGRKQGDFRGKWLLDTSDDISASHISERLADEPPGTLVVVDYLQLLDQRRDKPSLDVQVRNLKAFAQKIQSIVICLSQIAREYTLTSRACPSLQDVRMPNPLDLSIFDKSCFIQDGKMQLHSAGAALKL
jgi:replicative DNA helicase